ncbi:unnamed protein product (macronuclear) [Paramecium tetraurelia]|uniref:Acyl-CoA dehydrogenase family member 11 n=1 Tax=Paramecium tetraurelia TaxID=5888 RepID=A0BQK6_PARTE|nr:uncharacterized protein GSPATT00031052001 [Paramecium tetraurelia]CAK60823.1 unnamed protein product [Paramecium tetraurelia]|eukprot:XP_001428221.1 hypothetical protein (macronuclear) [Paramecium tetraurelia strain d4-2]
MFISAGQHKYNLSNYLNQQTTLAVFLGVKEVEIDQIQQLTEQIYKLSFKNSKKQIRFHTKSDISQVQGNQLEKDFTIAQKLCAANMPVPKALFYCKDQSVLGFPFYATEYVEGRIFNMEQLLNISQAKKRLLFQEVSKALAHLHSISFHYLGLGEVDQNTHHYETLNNKLHNLYKQHETKISTNMEDLLYWLSLNTPVKSDLDNLCLIHGDFSLSKVVFHPTKPAVLAILDWQQAQIGNAFVDLASFVLPYYIPYSNGQHQVDGWFGVEEIMGQPSIQDVLSAYFTTRSSQTITDIRYQLILSIVKSSIDQQIHYKQYKEEKYYENSLFLTKAGYEIISEMTEGDPFGIKMRATNDGQIWSHWPVSERCKSYYYRIKDFMRDEVFPIEKAILDKAREVPRSLPNKPITELEELQRKAKSVGLWNLFILDPMYGKGLTNLEYVFISEIIGLSFIGHVVFNCLAPETGNIRLLIAYGTQYQKEKYLNPLLEGKCKSFFAITEKDVSSADQDNNKFTITPTDGGFILNGGKWFVQNAADERAIFGIVVGKSSSHTNNPNETQSMILVEMNNPKIQITRQFSSQNFYDLPHSYSEIQFNNAFIPKENLLGQLGGAIKMIEDRLLEERLNHCARLNGLTRRSLDLTLSRSEKRVIFKEKLKDNAAFQEKLGDLEIAYQSCRLLCLNAGLLLDSVGNTHFNAFLAVSECKAHIPKASQYILDSCMQIFGAEGVTEEQPLSLILRLAKALRFVDGPCEFHLRQVSKFVYGNHIFNDLNNAQGYGLAKL